MSSQRPRGSDLDFETELQRRAELMERLAFEANQAAEKMETYAHSKREKAAVLAAKAAKYRNLRDAQPAPVKDEDIPL